MISILIVLAAVAGVAYWVSLSPTRILIPALASMAARPALTFWLTTAAAAVLAAMGVVIVLRSLRASGWRLVVAA